MRVLCCIRECVCVCCVRESSVLGVIGGREGRRAYVDVAVDDFPGRGAGYFDAVDGGCCVGHGEVT